MWSWQSKAPALYRSLIPCESGIVKHRETNSVNNTERIAARLNQKYRWVYSIQSISVIRCVYTLAFSELLLRSISACKAVS